jgi:hypothetical protein
LNVACVCKPTAGRETGEPDLRRGQDRASKLGPLQIGILKVGSLQVRALKQGAPEIRPLKLRPSKIRALKFGVTQICALKQGAPRKSAPCIAGELIRAP